MRKSQYQKSLTVIYFVFFIWGLIFCMNDILLPYLKSLFTLTYVRASLIQFTFFGTYLFTSIPAGKIVFKYGYKTGTVLGLLISALGCLLFYPAAQFKIYEIFLIALFILSTGITLLQVAANPFVTVLGNESQSASRLNFAQAINKLGYSIAPFVGAYFLFRNSSKEIVANVSVRPEDISLVQKPYLIFGVIFILLALLVYKSKFPPVSGESDAPFLKALKSAKKYPQLVCGAFGIFTYVGAEITTNAFFISLLSEPKAGGLTQTSAAKYLSYYWALATITGFGGFIALKYISPAKLLFQCGIVSMVLLVICLFISGTPLAIILVLLGGFISIMFPTIFSLAIEGLGNFTSHGSAILLTAVVGGALVPPVQALLADKFGIQISFVVPCFCYAYVTGYGYWINKRTNKKVLVNQSL